MTKKTSAATVVEFENNDRVRVQLGKRSIVGVVRYIRNDGQLRIESGGEMFTVDANSAVNISFDDYKELGQH